MTTSHPIFRGWITLGLLVLAQTLLCPIAGADEGADQLPSQGRLLNFTNYWANPSANFSEVKTSDQTKANFDAHPKQDDNAAVTKEAAAGILLKFNWVDGLVGESADKAFRIHLGGRFDFDNGWYHVPTNIQNSLSTPLQDGTDFRRFRLEADGMLMKHVEFKIEADFSKASDVGKNTSSPQTNIFITDAWLALRDLPVIGTLKLGHQKEYMTFSNATSSEFTPFMERPYVYDAFENNFSFDNGLSLSRTYLDERVTSWVGAFWNNTRSEAFNVGAGNYGATGRLTCLPIYDEAGQRWLNVGVSGSVRSLHANPQSVTVRPLVRTGESTQVPDLIDTGTIYGRNGLQILGAGAHSAWGPLTVGSEFLCRFTPNAYLGGLPPPSGPLPSGVTGVGDLFFSGFYVEVLCFLTSGDHRSINKETPGYARVRPVRPLSWSKADGIHGLGAWELAARYDHVEVNSGLIQAGSLDSLTVGLNWYLNANAKVLVNYIYTNRQTADAAANGQFDGLGLRVHVDF